MAPPPSRSARRARPQKTKRESEPEERGRRGRRAPAAKSETPGDREDQRRRDERGTAAERRRQPNPRKDKWSLPHTSCSGLRHLDVLGLFAESRGKEEELDTFPQKWRYMGRFKRLLYLIYILPLLFILVCLAILLYIPWTILPSTRPKVSRTINEKTVREPQRRPRTDDAVRDVLAPIGYGPYWNVQPAISSWKSFWLRVGDLYFLIRDIVRMFTRQGLQVIGVLCGATMAIMQLVRVGSELRTARFSELVEATVTGGGMDIWKKQADCAYVVGTGLANWGEGKESFVWYILYHGWIFLLCLMLIADEVLNVRMGLLSPQWSRGGTGYTLIFLSLCLINSSPNWGWKIMIPIHYVILLAIMICGIYQVLRLALMAMDCTPDRSLARENRRSCRLPLRPWTTVQWKDAWKTGNFRENQHALEDLRDAQEHLDDVLRQQHRGADPAIWAEEQAAVDEAQEKLDKLYPAEMLQTQIGDHAREVRDKKELGQMIREGEVYLLDDAGMPKAETLSGSKKDEKPREELVRERGFMGRTLIHGGTIDPPRWTTEDHYLIARSIHSSYLTDDYDQDKFYVYIGGDPRLERVMGTFRRLYAWKNDILQPTYKAGWETKARLNHRWETKYEFEARAKRNRKCLEGYVGNHDWTSPLDHKRKMFVWFDMRRYLAVFVGVWMVLVHIAILVTVYGPKVSLTTQHEEAAAAWKTNRGPSDESCQYYQGSPLAIWIRPGGSSWKGILLAFAFFGAWETFIIGLCLGVILVAATNNRTYGMHFVVPISLIGPRLSSVSLGWTLSFVGAATLQMGLFHYQDGLRWFARIGGYLCIATWILFIFPNEEMRAIVSRRPILKSSALSLWAHEWLDRKKVLKRRRDAEYE